VISFVNSSLDKVKVSDPESDIKTFIASINCSDVFITFIFKLMLALLPTREDTKDIPGNHASCALLLFIFLDNSVLVKKRTIISYLLN
jgi:hypothetical protein